MRSTIAAPTATLGVFLHLLFQAGPVAAQSFDAASLRPLPVSDGARSFFIESTGGVGGGVAGFALGYWASGVDECGSEEIECVLESLGVMMLAGTTGGAVGTYLAGRWGGTAPSGWGAVLGSVVGTAAGIAFFKALDDAGTEAGDAVVVVGFGAIQGLFAALGSRLGTALR